jgi:hypothetical protein
VPLDHPEVFVDLARDFREQVGRIFVPGFVGSINACARQFAERREPIGHCRDVRLLIRDR